MKGKIVSEKEYPFGKTKGTEYMIEMPKGQMARYRLLVGVLVFRSAVIGTKEQVASKDADIFPESFKLTTSKKK